MSRLKDYISSLEEAETFANVDTNKNGAIDPAEFAKWAQSKGIPIAPAPAPAPAAPPPIVGTGYDGAVTQTDIDAHNATYGISTPAATNSSTPVPPGGVMTGKDITGRPVMKGSPNDVTSQGTQQPPSPAPAPAPAEPKNRDSMTFGQAFADARKNKEKVFTWKGKKYGTQLAAPGTNPNTSGGTTPGGTSAKPSAYADPDVGGQGGQNAAWLNKKFPTAQVGQEYWVKGTRYEKNEDGWYRTFEKSDWFAKPINRAASNAGYTGPADDASMQAWWAKNRPAQPAATPAAPGEIPMYENKESGYDEIQRIVSIVHHR